MNTETVEGLLATMKPDFLRKFVGRDEENETKVKTEFWAKVKKCASKIPFLEEVVALWFCAKDAKTPKRVKTSIFAALAYFILPTDLIADFVPGIGYMDDATVIVRTLKSVHDHVSDEHRTLARQHINMRLGVGDDGAMTSTPTSPPPSNEVIVEEVE